jgi:hypothetical protein
MSATLQALLAVPRYPIELVQYWRPVAHPSTTRISTIQRVLTQVLPSSLTTLVPLIVAFDCQAVLPKQWKQVQFDEYSDFLGFTREIFVTYYESVAGYIYDGSIWVIEVLCWQYHSKVTPPWTKSGLANYACRMAINSFDQNHQSQISYTY